VKALNARPSTEKINKEPNEVCASCDLGQPNILLWNAGPRWPDLAIFRSQNFYEII
jgi:hypothetical protein